MLSEPTTSLPAVAQLQVPGAFKAVYTVGYQVRLTVAVIHVANTTSNACTVSVCGYPTGGSATAATALLWACSIPPNDFLEFGQGLILPSGWTLAALGGTALAATITLSGITQ